MQDEDQDGDLSPPWSEVVVVTKNLTTFVLNDLPPGQTILSTPKLRPLKCCRRTQCSIPTRASLQCARLHTARNPLSSFRGNSEKFVAFLARASAGSAGSEIPGN